MAGISKGESLEKPPSCAAVIDHLYSRSTPRHRIPICHPCCQTSEMQDQAPLLLQLSLQPDDKRQLLAPHVNLAKFVPISSHPKLAKKESVIPLCKSDAGNEKKCPSAAWQTVKAERDRLEAHSPPTTPQLLPTPPPGCFCGTAAPTGGKGPSPWLHLPGSSAQRGLTPRVF